MVCSSVEAEIPASKLLNLDGGIGVDHRYSVAALTDETGAMVERYGYDAYGNSTVLDAAGSVERDEALQAYRTTGRRYDDETGLYYFRARYFDAQLGRFVGRDPLGYVDGASQYMAYFAPSALDPFGESVVECPAGWEMVRNDATEGTEDETYDWQYFWGAGTFSWREERVFDDWDEAVKFSMKPLWARIYVQVDRGILNQVIARRYYVSWWNRWDMYYRKNWSSLAWRKASRVNQDYLANGCNADPWSYGYSQSEGEEISIGAGGNADFSAKVPGTDVGFTVGGSVSYTITSTESDEVSSSSTLATEECYRYRAYLLELAGTLNVEVKKVEYFGHQTISMGNSWMRDQVKERGWLVCRKYCENWSPASSN